MIAADPRGLLDVPGVRPELRRLALAFLEEAERVGLTLRVVSVLRPLEEQARLYAQGRTAPGPIVTWAKPGTSPHNYGAAFDVAFLDARGRPSWDEAHPWAVLGPVAKRVGLVWGGTWAKKPDRPHLELPDWRALVGAR